MTKKVKIILIVAVVLSLVSALVADNNHNKPYLRMGLGAKGMAMGGTGTAYMNNITASYWNPAGLSKIQTFEVGFNYTDLNNDREHNFVAAGMRHKYGYVALSWLNSGTSDIDKYDMNNNEVGSYDATDNNINLSLATRTGDFHWGLNIKMMFDNIDDDNKSGYGIDLGAIYDINHYLSVGLMARDIMSEFDDDDIPYELSAGVAVYPINGVTVTADVRQEEDADDATVHIGAEYWTSIGSDTETGSGLCTMKNNECTSWSDIFSNVQAGLRAGANDGNFTVGFGVRYKMIEMNYAFEQVDEESINEDTHRYELIFRF